MGGNAFCFKVCDPSKEHAADYCQHIYDVMGCDWNMPGDYSAGSFDSCKGDSGEVRPSDPQPT